MNQPFHQWTEPGYADRKKIKPCQRQYEPSRPRRGTRLSTLTTEEAEAKAKDHRASLNADREAQKILFAKERKRHLARLRKRRSRT